MKARMIIPVFIPHQGCPYRCAYCDQNAVTGESGRADRERVETAIRTYLGSVHESRLPDWREVAFYGGSFTGLPPARQALLLDQVRPWMESRRIHAIRVSTHPLFVDEERMRLLRAGGVATVELGLQSTDPKVLELSGRPCEHGRLVAAVKDVRAGGFSLGLQLMSGLPGDDEKSFLRTVDDAIGFQPDFVRLYPALVLRGTALHDLYATGSYVPWSLERTVDNLAEAVRRFRAAGIDVVRMGLPAEPSMKENYVSGPIHPSLGYLVESRIALDEMTKIISGRLPVTGRVEFRVPARLISHFVGHRRSNIKILHERFRLKRLTLRPEQGAEQLLML